MPPLSVVCSSEGGQEGSLAETEARRLERLKTVGKWIGIRVASATIFTAIFVTGVVHGGEILIDHFNETVVDPAKSKVDENGRSLRQGLDNNSNGIEAIKNGGVKVEITIPGTGPTQPDQSVVGLPNNPENAAGPEITSTSTSSTTSIPNETNENVNNFPPNPIDSEHDAAP